LHSLTSQQTFTPTQCYRCHTT